MPSDFGDESGEKLFDWMLRIGQDAGVDAMSAAAAKVTAALKKTRGGLADVDEPEKATPEWGKLSLEELGKLDEYTTVLGMVKQGLVGADIEHGILFDGKNGHDCLLFHLDDANRVAEVFDEVTAQVEGLCEKVCKSMSKEVSKDQSIAKENAKYESLGQIDPVGKAAGKTPDARKKTRNSEPLEERASRARESAAALEHDKGKSRDIGRDDRFEEVRSR